MPPATTNAELKLTPTVLIGLGGTGKDVILRIRRLFFERFGHANRYPIIGTVVLDTNNKDLDKPAGPEVPAFVRRQIALTDADDVPSFVYCKLEDNEFRDYFSGGYMTYPHVFRWLPQSMDRYGVAAIKDGAGQNRLFGRLMWFHHYHRIRQVLTAHFQRVIKYAVQPELFGNWLPPGARVEPGQIEVALVYSLAGGTGCGMFLDTGMLVREILRDFPNVNPYITHYMVLPDALTSPKGVPFDSIQKKKVEENAFAALREMEYFAVRREGQFDLFDLSVPPRADDVAPAADRRPPLFEVTWEKDRAPTPITDAPWDTCYLIGASNDSLRGTPLAHHDLYQMVSEHLFLDFDPSDFGERKRTTRSNLVGQTLEMMRDPVRDENGAELYSRVVSRRFSTLGLAQLQFDRDRMRRAAAHRLAKLLVERWWLRSNGLGPADLRDRAKEDLGPDAADAAGDKVTRTGREPDRWEIPRLGLQALALRLTRTGPGAGDTWITRVNQEYQRNLAAIESEAFDPFSDDVLAKWSGEHLERLTPPNVGAATSGERGLALKTFEDNQRQLLGDVDARLAHLFWFRVESLGLADALALVGAYEELNRGRAVAADQLRGKGPPGAGGWPARVAEARRLPLYARRVARLELLRGVRAAWTQITSGYQSGLAEHLTACFKLIDRRVGQLQADGSYQASLRAFIGGLDGVRAFLQARFTELSVAEAGRRDTAGRPDEATVQTGRVTALLEQQTEDEYDRRITAALGWPSFDPAAAGGEARWRDIERKVLAELARATDRRLQNVESVSELVTRFFPLDRRDPAAARDLDSLARELARACGEALPAFGGDLSALREYLRHAKPDQLLSYLRVYSAPYLRKDNSVTIAREVDIPPIQLLGLSGYDSSDGRRLIDSLRQSGEHDPLPLAGMQTLDMKDDAIVLYREKAGIPLAYYADLEHLGRQYDGSNRKLEVHLDHSFLNGRLPEIRKIDQRKMTTLAGCLKLALLGIATGVVAFDRVRPVAAGRGRPPERDQVTFSYRYRDLPRNLGQQLDEVVRRLADDVNVDMRNDLSGQIARWFTDQAGRESGLAVAALWAAMKSLHAEIRDRVGRIVAQAPDRALPAVDHPLQAYLGDHVIPFVRGRLDGIPGAADWIRPLLEFEAVATDRYSTAADRADARRRWDEYVAPSFTRINDADMPIPVLKHPSPRFAADRGTV